MSIQALALVVLAALIHATWNLLAKRAAAAGAAFVFTTSVFSNLLYLPWAIWLVLHGAAHWSPQVLGMIVASGLLHTAYSLCLQRGYQVADLSVVYPVARGTGPLLSSIGALLLLGERPGWRGVAGMLSVVAGIACISVQGRWTLFQQSSARRGVAWGGATGALIASYTVVDAISVKLIGLHPVVLDCGSNLVRFFTLLPWMARNARGAVSAMRGHWGKALAVGALSPMSYILVLAALQGGAPLSLVAPAREMSMMAAAVLGMVVLGEPLGRWRLGGCVLVMLGVILLASA